MQSRRRKNSPKGEDDGPHKKAFNKLFGVGEESKKAKGRPKKIDKDESIPIVVDDEDAAPALGKASKRGNDCSNQEQTAKRGKAAKEPASNSPRNKEPASNSPPNKENKSERANGNGSRGSGDNTVEQMYQKKTQLEHILLRPDTYVGSIERQESELWVLDSATKRMVNKKIEFVPALYKIFDEILVNAADNLVRDPTQDTIKIDINAKANRISVWNNGKGVPVVKHKEHGVYIPDLIFGHLLTSDNYDDSERKVVGGRNGYGAKLTNIFSTSFSVETVDTERNLHYLKVWEKNMSGSAKEQVKRRAGQCDFTQITFQPDLARFGMDCLEEDIVSLFQRRAYDIAASTHGRCKVFLNGNLLPVQSFDDYVALYLGSDAWRVSKVISDRWEIAIGLTDGSGFKQVSFVNSISTPRGGTHINLVADQFVGAVMDKIDSKKKDNSFLTVKPQQVKGYFFLFVNCLIENPAFDSQTKETLTSKRERFGSTCEVPEDMLQALLDSGVLETINQLRSALGQSELARHLNKSDRGMQARLFGIPKLEDANCAGTKRSSECTLILTEGDSAKALAVAGLSVVGRDTYGVFPLRGKLRNTRELTTKQLAENKEIDSLLKILALDANREYASTQGLRYGSVMIMADQDYDGSHIKGLLINFFQHWFPSLYKLEGFLKEFVTPIVKVKKDGEEHVFFTLPQYEAWLKDSNDGRGWTTKYYKGLGTSTSAEAKEYFSALEDHRLTFAYTDQTDDDLIDMAFLPSRSDDRKEWIQNCDDNAFVDHSEDTLTYQDFIKKELVLFAKYDVERAIPCMVDGLKPGQRKVLFAAFKRKLTSDNKVAQFAGYVAEHSAYHHGEASLQGTIIGMAQTYVGSNNINLFVPQGQFGTRLQGGKDHAAARYIYTRLAPLTRFLFHEDDDATLQYQQEEGLHIEPKWYCPIIPMVLVNGAQGIGTGWATSIPNFNPRDIIHNVRCKLRGQPMKPMQPWYKGYKGTINPVQGTLTKFECCGVAEKRGRTRLEITELPIHRWTQDYKEFLMEQAPKNEFDKRKSWITEFKEHHTEHFVHFACTMTPDKLAEAERKGVEKVFHLKGNISCTNMMLFDRDGQIKKYDTPEDIIEEFMGIRLEVYEKRKAHKIKKLQREVNIFKNKVRFINLVLNDELQISERQAEQVRKDLRKLKLWTMQEVEENAFGKEGTAPKAYEYLLSMKLWTLTEEKAAVLEKQYQDKAEQLEKLRRTKVEDMWEQDLSALEVALNARDAEEAKEEAREAKLMKKARAGDSDEGLVNSQCVIVLSRNHHLKRVRTDEWEAKQKRGGRGKRQGLLAGTKKDIKKGKKGTKDDAKETQGDSLEQADPQDEGQEEEEEAEDDANGLAGIFPCHEFDALLAFSENGMVFMMQALDVPLAKRKEAGIPFAELLPALGPNHQIKALITVPQGALKEQNDLDAILISKGGLAKRVCISKFRGLRPGTGLMAMPQKDGDELRWALRATNTDAVVTCSEDGMLLRFPSLGLPSATVKGNSKPAMKMNQNDQLAACAISPLTTKEIARLDAEFKAKQEKKKSPPSAFFLYMKESGGTLPDCTTNWAKMSNDDKKPWVDKAAAAAVASGCAEANGEDEEDGALEDGDAADASGAEEDEKDEVPGEQAAGSQGALAADCSLEGPGCCLLIVTENGLGKRVPATLVGLRKRGQKGRKVISIKGAAKGNPNDAVVALCSVHGDVAPDPPERPKEIWRLVVQDHPELGSLYDFSKYGEVRQKAMHFFEGADSKTKQEYQNKYDASMIEFKQKMEEHGFQKKKAKKARTALAFFHEHAHKKYLDQGLDDKEVLNAIAEEWKGMTMTQREPYEVLRNEEIKRIRAAPQEEVQEVLLSSEQGVVSRLLVSCIPIGKRTGAGKIVMKPGKGDSVSSASLISSRDQELDEDDDEAKNSATDVANAQESESVAVLRNSLSGELEEQKKAAALKAKLEEQKKMKILAAPAPRTPPEGFEVAKSRPAPGTPPGGFKKMIEEIPSMRRRTLSFAAASRSPAPQKIQKSLTILGRSPMNPTQKVRRAIMGKTAPRLSLLAAIPKATSERTLDGLSIGGGIQLGALQSTSSGSSFEEPEAKRPRITWGLSKESIVAKQRIVGKTRESLVLRHRLRTPEVNPR